MQTTRPHFLLFTEASAAAGVIPQWRFVLQLIGGENFLAADDLEPGTSESRLELLAVVRGLEALDEPSRVTLLTASRYVSRGVRRGLSQWRERKWRWERFGQLVPIRNQDLWLRVDRALEFHEVEFWPAHLAIGNCDLEQAANAGTAESRPAVEATSPATESSSVPRRRFDRAELDSGVRGPFFSILNRLRQGVLAPLAAFRRPAFTRAA